MSLPHPDDTMPVVRSLIDTLLAFEHPRFPAVSREDVERRLLEYFPLEDLAYANLRRALLYFGEVDLAPHAAVPIADAERELLEAAGVADASAKVEARIEQERRASAGQNYSSTVFAKLGAPERARYLQTWATSALVMKRRLYRTTKSMVMIAAFSLEPSWLAIGYEGPLLENA